MASEVVKLEDVKQDAFILWAGGCSCGQAAAIIPMTKQGFRKIILKIKRSVSF